MNQFIRFTHRFLGAAHLTNRVSTAVAVCLMAGLLAAQEPAKKTVPTHKASQKWALLIGVNDYSYITKLKYCGVDMESLRNQLVASGFSSKQIRLMTDSAKDRKYLPGKLNIETQIDLVTSLV